MKKVLLTISASLLGIMLLMPFFFGTKAFAEDYVDGEVYENSEEFDQYIESLSKNQDNEYLGDYDNWDDYEDYDSAYIVMTIPDNTIVEGSSTKAYADAYSSRDGARLEIVWSSSDNSVASVLGYGEEAKIDAHKEGRANITATFYVAGEWRDSDSCWVYVTKKPEPKYISVYGIMISNEYIEVNSGETVHIGASVNPTNANNQKINWSSENNSVVTVDSNGNIKGVAPGAAYVYARTEENGYTAKCKVNVLGPKKGVEVQDVWVNPTAVTLCIQQYMYITPNVIPSNAANPKVTWVSSNPGIVTVTETGKITGVSAGQAIITCITVDQQKMATTTVTVAPILAPAASGNLPKAPANATPVTSKSTRDAKFLLGTVNAILNAKKNATVTIPAVQPMAYDINVANALILRPDVTLVSTFPFNGHQFSMTIPKGYNLTSRLGKDGYVEWLSLCAPDKANKDIALTMK